MAAAAVVVVVVGGRWWKRGDVTGEKDGDGNPAELPECGRLQRR